MKKIKYLFIAISSFIGISSVKADTINYTIDHSLLSGSNYEYSSGDIYSFIIDSEEDILNYYTEYYEEDYPYYVLSLDYAVIGLSRVDLYLYLFDTLPTFNSMFIGSLYNSIALASGVVHYSIYCSDSSNCYSDLSNILPSSANRYNYPLFTTTYNNLNVNYYLPFAYYDSNFDLIYSGSDDINIMLDDYVMYSLSNGDIIPTFNDLYMSRTNYVNVELNNYSYVILSLKDYTNNSSINPKFQVKGQLCLTPLYNYGMVDSSYYYPDSVIMGCLPKYSEFTSYGLHISSSQISNHVVYYAKARNFLFDNVIKVDTNVFDITYITFENEDNPSVIIGGRSYPTIPYSDLTNTAETTYESYFSDNDSISDHLDFSSIISAPLNALTNIWSSIVSILVLVSTFIALLPPTMQAFLYSSFALAICLGVIKIVI